MVTDLCHCGPSKCLTGTIQARDVSGGSCELATNTFSSSYSVVCGLVHLHFGYLPLPSSYLHEIMMSDTGAGLEPSPVQNVSAQYSKFKRQYQQILDRWTPHIVQRWLATAGLLAVFMLRIVLAQGVSSFFSARRLFSCLFIVVYR